MARACASGRSLAEHVEDDVAILRLVELEQQQALPPAEQRLALADGDGVGGPTHDLAVTCDAAVRPLVALLEGSGSGAPGRRARSSTSPGTSVSRRVRRSSSAPSSHSLISRATVVWAQNATAQPVGHARVLDGPAELVGQVDHVEPRRRADLDGRVADFTVPPSSSALTGATPDGRPRSHPWPAPPAVAPPQDPARRPARGRERQREPERGPAPFGAVDPDPSAVAPRPRTARWSARCRCRRRTARPRRIHPVEALEHERLVLLGDAGSGVLDGDFALAVAADWPTP